MKKLLCVFLCLMLLVPSALAEGMPRALTENDPAYAWICEKSTELAALLDEALRSDGYLSIYFPQDQFGGELANLRKHDFSHPAAVAVLPRREKNSAAMFATARPATSGSVATSSGGTSATLTTADISRFSPGGESQRWSSRPRPAV